MLIHLHPQCALCCAVIIITGTTSFSVHLASNALQRTFPCNQALDSVLLLISIVVHNYRRPVKRPVLSQNCKKWTLRFVHINCPLLSDAILRVPQKLQPKVAPLPRVQCRSRQRFFFYKSTYSSSIAVGMAILLIRRSLPVMFTHCTQKTVCTCSAQ